MMKVSLLLLVCAAAVVSATTVTAPTVVIPGGDTQFIADYTWAKGPPEISTSNGPVATKSYIIGDAGSGDTRLIIAVKGAKIVTIKNLQRIVDLEDSTSTNANRPKVYTPILEILKKNTDIKFVVIGATAGARNDLLLAGNPKIDTFIGYICGNTGLTGSGSGVTLDFCKSVIIPGTTEGFLGWYDAWTTKGKDTTAPFCYMEFGGASSQIAVGSTSSTANVQVTFRSGSNEGEDKMKVSSLSGVQLGFNVISDRDSSFSRYSNAAVLTDCDANVDPVVGPPAVPGGIKDFGKCKTAAQAFFTRDTVLTGCITTHKAALQTCTKINVRINSKNLVVNGGTPANDATVKIKAAVVIPNPDDTTGTFDSAMKAVANCKCTGKVADDKFKSQYTCARCIMWNKWYNTMFGDMTTTKPSLDELDVPIEWFQGFEKIMIVNKFDRDLTDALMAGQTTPASDCMALTSNALKYNANNTAKQYALRLRLGGKNHRNGRKAVSLSLKF